MNEFTFYEIHFNETSRERESMIKEVAKLPDFVTVNLCPSLLIKKSNHQALRELIRKGVPVGVLRQDGYRLADYLLTGADILAEETFTGDIYSMPYFVARFRLNERLKRKRIDA